MTGWKSESRNYINFTFCLSLQSIHSTRFYKSRHWPQATHPGAITAAAPSFVFFFLSLISYRKHSYSCSYIVGNREKRTGICTSMDETGIHRLINLMSRSSIRFIRSTLCCISLLYVYLSLSYLRIPVNPRSWR